jgi:L-ascorbate metabolism protein UlaG (beta-lactamase superfamily)
MRRSPMLLSGLLALTIGLPAAAQKSDDGEQSLDTPRVHLTWMSIANWLFELNDVRILMDGYFTRVPAPPFFFGGGGGLAFTEAAFPIDVPMVLKVREAIGDPIHWVYTGHSHFDHSWDSPLWAALTGAQLIGSRSTCLQALGQNLPANQCSEILGGERLSLGDGVTGFVVRWNHSGSSANPEQHDPVELAAPPVPDPVTGGFRAGVSEDYPNGGGGRMMLFVVERGGTRVSFFVNDSASAVDLAVPIVVDGVNHGAPIDNLRAAMAEAALDSVDLWIGTGGRAVAELVVPVLLPRAYIPNHWDGLYAPFLAGLPLPYADANLTAYLAAQGIPILPQTQYMDGYALSPDGVERVENRELKAALGFALEQPFSPATIESAQRVDTALSADCDAPTQ